MKYLGLIFSNLFRKKFRFLLTIGSFAVALFLFGFLAAIKTAFSGGVDVAGADRLIVINRVTIIQPIPLSYRDKILRIPGVKQVTHQNWFGGVYQDEKNFFPQFVIDVENQRQVYPELEVPEDEWNNFVKDRQGAIAGARTSAGVMARRMRTRFSPRCTSNSAMPVSVARLINSRISSTVINGLA